MDLNFTVCTSNLINKASVEHNTPLKMSEEENAEPESMISPSSSHSLPAAAAAAGRAPSAGRPATASSAVAGQMAKLREANAKYKNLLKMAKERIQEQEGVLEERRCEYFCISAEQWM